MDFKDFKYVGRVRRVRPEDSFLVSPLAGELPLVICDPDAGPMLAYFDAKRRPKVGTKVGVCGNWIETGEPATVHNTPPGFPLFPGTRRVEFQVQVTNWVRVSEDFDWLMERLQRVAG